MADATVGEQVEEIGINGVPCKCAQGEGRDESCGGGSEERLHIGTRGAECAHDLWRLVGGDGASDAKDNESSGEALAHARTAAGSAWMARRTNSASR